MINIETCQAEELNKDEWRGLQAISRAAFTTTLNRSPYEIDALIDWNHADEFAASHIDPNVLIGTKYQENMAFNKPLVAIASDGHDRIGFSYAVNNVYGRTEQTRHLKELSVVQNYFLLRETSVLPDYQRANIAKRMGQQLLARAEPLQTPIAYVWPEEMPFLATVLDRFGFIITKTEKIRLFGHDSEPVKQYRMQATSVHSLLQRLSS